MNDDTSFSYDNVKPISSFKKADPHKVQDEIEKRPQGVSAYFLAKHLSISYPTCARICKTLEFAELVKSKVIIGENNRAVKLYFSTHAQKREEVKE